MLSCQHLERLLNPFCLATPKMTVPLYRGDWLAGTNKSTTNNLSAVDHVPNGQLEPLSSTKIPCRRDARGQHRLASLYHLFNQKFSLDFAVCKRISDFRIKTHVYVRVDESRRDIDTGHVDGSGGILHVFQRDDFSIPNTNRGMMLI